MKNKIHQFIIIIIFVVLLCASWIIWPIVSKYTNDVNHENRNLTKFPSLNGKTYSDFPNEFEAYLNDRIPFRNPYIAMNASIDYYVFKTSSNEKVIIGDERWLFLDDITDGDPIGCYEGINLFSQEELEVIAKNCEETRQLLEDEGKEFVLFIAPNKERIYNEFLPERYGAPAETYKVLQLVNYLRENTSVRVVYPYEELINAKKQINQNIYYKTDTHWNEIGGYVGASALLDELGMDMPAINSDEIIISKDKHHAGDLANLINLNKQLKKYDYEYSVDGFQKPDMVKLEDDFNTVIHYKSPSADKRKIYIFRDSFATNMAETIGSQFSESYMRHNSTFTYDDYVKQNPDIFVYETVERTIGWLKDFNLCSFKDASNDQITE